MSGGPKREKNEHIPGEKDYMMGSSISGGSIQEPSEMIYDGSCMHTPAEGNSGPKKSVCLCE